MRLAHSASQWSNREKESRMQVYVFSVGFAVSIFFKRFSFYFHYELAYFLKQSQEYLMSAIKEDFQTSGGKCLLEIVSEGYMPALLGWVLQKRSPYTDIINKG